MLDLLDDPTDPDVFDVYDDEPTAMSSRRASIASGDYTEFCHCRYCRNPSHGKRGRK